MIWNYWACVMPDDDGAAIAQIATAMELAGHWITEPELIGHVVRVHDQPALIFLRMALEGASVFGPNELLIAVEDRPECERLLREQCPSHVEWSCLIHIATSTAKATAMLHELHAECMEAWGQAQSSSSKLEPSKVM